MAREATPPKTAFGTRIRGRREELNLSKGELANRLRWSTSFLDFLERGLRGCDPDDLPRIAEALQLDARQLAKLYISEKYPALFRALFGDEERPEVHASSSSVEDVHWRLDQLPRKERGLVEALTLTLHDLTSRASR
jgi:transcriptional regulator with XRE-family HTH domain